MKVIVFEERAYYKMLDEMKQVVKEATHEYKAEAEQKEWLSTEEAKTLLGFKSKTKLQQLRDNGEIIFSQHGRIIRYSRKSIMSFLESNIID